MDIFDEMVKKWPSSVVARSEIKLFSGGLVSPKTLANLDSLGRGPAESFNVNGKTCYPTPVAADWLRNKMVKDIGSRRRKS